MSTLYKMFDAAYPPAEPYPGCRAVAGYIGGNTPHVWTADEWRRFGDLVQFPVWVGAAEADPAEHARQAAAAMHDLGWAELRPERRTVILDEETQISRTWINTFAGIMWSSGYETMIYGSMSTILDNPVKEGRWIALYDGQPDIPDISGAIGHQYLPDVAWDGTQVDLSVVTDTMLTHGGIGPRKAA